MTDKTFRVPEGRDLGDINFIRAKHLAEQHEAGELSDDGVIVEGIYEGSQQNQMNDQRLDYKFKLDDGREVVVNGAGNLGYKMKFVSPGDYVQIQYLGMQEITKGPQKGRKAHNFEVLTAE